MNKNTVNLEEDLKMKLSLKTKELKYIHVEKSQVKYPTLLFDEAQHFRALVNALYSS